MVPQKHKGCLVARSLDLGKFDNITLLGVSVLVYPLAGRVLVAFWIEVGCLQ